MLPGGWTDNVEQGLKISNKKYQIRNKGIRNKYQVIVALVSWSRDMGIPNELNINNPRTLNLKPGTLLRSDNFKI